ncbi:unnamed protein product [Cuscuta campestris]|uniref:Protein CMSS1 n=2 Tax=Cuscuta sect. Cleistogrammica TaxID=1824901 RepID=A0A484L7X0_9ASTE|nr:hypothetical protein DM860_005778 [Cuscuta australis]VFQ72423.1 unnamed protein product [Cuscuta campestris]
MGSGKEKKRKTNNDFSPRPKKLKTKKEGARKGHDKENGRADTSNGKKENGAALYPTASEQLKFFIHHYQSANRVQLSPLELESFKDTCMVELIQDQAENKRTLGDHLKAAFGSSWKDLLCRNQFKAGKVEPGHPALIVISSSALRSLELLRELRLFTKECPPAKLFSKHMKIDEQVSFLKNRVNIASGTPSRIKKLIDMEALGLSRLTVVVLDMQMDVKGYSLLTLPQVREEVWDLYKSYFHERMVEGTLRMCLYGPLPEITRTKKVVDD